MCEGFEQLPVRLENDGVRAPGPVFWSAAERQLLAYLLKFLLARPEDVRVWRS
jgi:hypothetical protein